MDTITGKEAPHKILPFNNLFLNSGFVSGFNDWWMYLVTILATICCYSLGQLLVLEPLMAHAHLSATALAQLKKDPGKFFDPEFMGIDKNLMLMILLAFFVLAASGFILCIKRLHLKSLTSILTGYERFRFSRFWFAFGIWGGFVVLTTLISYAVSPEEFTVNINWSGFLIATALMFVFMPVQTGFEEALFRGYLMQGLAQVFKNGWVPLLITSFLFGSAHMTNPEVKEYGWPVMLTYFVSFALFMGGLSLLDEGLELAFGIHFANNFISSILVSEPGSVLHTYSIFESKKSDNAYSELIAWFCMATLTFFILWRKYRWKNFKLILN